MSSTGERQKSYNSSMYVLELCRCLKSPKNREDFKLSFFANHPDHLEKVMTKTKQNE